VVKIYYREKPAMYKSLKSELALLKEVVGSNPQELWLINGNCNFYRLLDEIFSPQVLSWHFT